MNPAIHQGYLPGAIGRIAELHAGYYSRLAGFGLPFEAKVAREVSDFCQAHVDGRDGLWLALDGGRIVGAMAIDGSHAQEDGAHLRWFIVADGWRGQGLGTVLMGSALSFCRSCSYDRVFLWTFEGLDAARHLYEKSGFRLVHQQRGTRWGAEVNEQRFELRM